MSLCARYKGACSRLGQGMRALQAGSQVKLWKPISTHSLTTSLASTFNCSLNHASLSSRLFSTQSDEMPRNLVEVLESEIEEETKLARQNMEGKETPSIPGFTIKTDEAEVTLTKSHGSENITITFNVNNSVEASEDDEAGDLETPTDPTAAGTEMASRPAFVVDIEKGAQKLSFECQAVYTEETGPQEVVDIVNVCIYGAGGKLEDKVYVAETAHMDQNLYEPLVEFLAERGINEEFMKQLVEFSTHYEHAQYVNMLKKIKSFMDA